MVTKIKYPIGGFAPGSYIVKCIRCKKKFRGDKRAVECEACATNNLQDKVINMGIKLGKYEDALRAVRDNVHIINELLNS